MAKFKIGDEVLVPAARMAVPDNHNFALVPRKIAGIDKKSILVDDADHDDGYSRIGMRLAHTSHPRFLIMRVGDLSTDRALLDPLAKSLNHFLRLLVRDEDRSSIEIRTAVELRKFWAVEGSAATHVILIGHGSDGSLHFLDGRDGGPGTGSAKIRAEELANLLVEAAPAAPPKVFLSLVCRSGRAAFARSFSESAVCQSLIAPFDSVHGAAAAHVCQSFLMWHLLGGFEFATAYRRSIKSVPNGAHFKYWRNGWQEPSGKSPFWW